MNVLLTGAAGFVGRHVLRMLEDHGHIVTACVHKRALTTRNTLQLDFRHMHKAGDWRPFLEGIDVVINSVGIIAQTNNQSFEALHTRSPSALFRACEQVGVKRVIQISALGADENAITPYHLTKKAADDRLRQTNLDWFILQPSLIYGKGGASFKLFKRLSQLPIILLFDNGAQLIQPVHISDVLATISRCLNTAKTRQTIKIVGPKAVTYKQWLLKLRDRPSDPWFLSIPMRSMIRLARMGKFINMPALNPDSMRMLAQNNTADSAGITAFLGRTPRSITQGLALSQ